MPFVNCQTVVHGGPNQMDESLEDSSEDEEDPFKTMLLESMQESQFEKTPKPYLPQDTIDKIFCPRSKRKNDIDWKIFEPMGINVAALTDDELSLAYHIVATCPKLYLIAVFIELEPEPLRTLMSIFRQDGFTDKDIPIDVWPMDKLKAGIKQHPFYVLEKKYPVRKRRIWNLSRINKFQSEQWRFLAPIISTSEPLHDFGQCTIPFVAKHDIIGKGGNGIVYKYEIHNAHFKDPISLFSATEARVNGSDRVRIKNVVAVKEIRNQGSEVAKRWEREVRALARMNKLRQEHIVRFITAFRRKGTSDDIEHYVVFEWADGGNLSDLRAAYPNPGLTAARIKWVVRQLYGLAQALSKAHYLEGEGSYRHGDLKPANILWFKQGDTEFGTLKIGDWGEAKEHDNVTALRHDTTAQSGTRRYEPPEVVTGVPSSLSQESRFVRSRLYDIWGIGCITLEIIIWLVYGLSELKRFDKENIGTYGISEFFYEVSLNKPAKVHGVAEYWMEQIAKDPRCSRHTSALGDLLEIVRTNLLIVKLPVDGGAKGPHLSPNYLVEKQASNTGGLQPATSISENLFNENGNKISIQITSEWRDATLAGPEEPRRCRATEFEDRLEKILAFEQDESYWSKGCAPRPAPAASRRSDLLSVESAPIALARGALSPMSEQKDYGKANYDPEAWFFVLDNDFAKQILDRLKDARLSPPTTISASNVLCDKCAAVRGVIWSSFFKITYETARLAHNASEQICELCSLLWRTYEKFSSSRSHEVMFQRSGSMLLMDALKSPVLTLSRNNEPRSRARDVQIGFGDLPAPGQDVHLEILRGWLDHCDNNHACRPKRFRDVRTPTRLIDVGSIGGDVVRLREMQLSDNDDWIALSYQWGSVPHTSTTTKNKDAHIAGMTMDKLPQTFQDAIKITRSLGKRYLWIDSICIIQGKGGDFSEQSKRMEDVYSGAYCVLAASCATDQKSGFLLPRQEARRYVTLEAENGADGIFYVCERIENFKEHVLEGDLCQRGWVLQERALARRTIFFTQHQTYWECGDWIRCETLAKMKNDSAAFLGDPEFPKLLDPTNVKKGEQIKRFQELYQQYSRLTLSRDHDRPAAINGLQQRLLRTMNVRGGFGVFDDVDKSKGLLRRSLLWHRGHSIPTLPNIEFPQDRENVPSWSWMAVSGGIDYFHLDFNGFNWQPIESPWSSPMQSGGDRVIKALACDFKLPVAESQEHDIIFDDSRRSKQDQTRAIVLGIEKGLKATEEKKHYVLVVDLTTLSDPGARKDCKRVGAGYLPGKWLTGEPLLCALN